jgi:hypothetical protein
VLTDLSPIENDLLTVAVKMLYGVFDGVTEREERAALTAIRKPPTAKAYQDVVAPAFIDKWEQLSTETQLALFIVAWNQVHKELPA